MRKTEGMLVATRYEVGEPLGSGGEARVFRAVDRETQAEVAIRLEGRHGTETLSPAPPSHPGWVRQLDRGIDEQHGAFSIYEILDGETLAQIAGRMPLACEAWLDFTRQSLAAVAALHESRWIHGDLNAANFLLHGGVTWKLLELPFHQPGPPENRSPLFGSIYTLAPEQIEGRRPDSRSDLFSLGCLYYYAASGKYPHGDGSEAEIAIGRLRFPPALLHELAPSLPRHLADWTHCLLARDAADRPADAAAALRSLDV